MRRGYQPRILLTSVESMGASLSVRKRQSRYTCVAEVLRSMAFVVTNMQGPTDVKFLVRDFWDLGVCSELKKEIYDSCHLKSKVRTTPIGGYGHQQGLLRDGDRQGTVYVL